MVYNDDSFVYAARLEEDIDDVRTELEDLSSSDDDIDSDVEDDAEHVGAQGKVPFDEEKHAEAEHLEEVRRHAEDGEGEPEELEEKTYKREEKEEDREEIEASEQPQ